ncbi:hypothetical protein [Roseobacter ponti]|uniref:Uncharacterized protein n=1 Tax=Roseobacter ponti TaxID=1891787 RepID=A0A858SSL1_9RHOB|nr:hypothetical protein [Roseobacter ponti]QJF50967.1 hypothetical protein G3256_07245 [Roseobacter ponti]
MERVLNMILRMVIRRLTSRGISAAVSKAGGGQRARNGTKHIRRSARMAGRATRM